MIHNSLHTFIYIHMFMLAKSVSFLLEFELSLAFLLLFSIIKLYALFTVKIPAEFPTQINLSFSNHPLSGIFLIISASCGRYISSVRADFQHLFSSSINELSQCSLERVSWGFSPYCWLELVTTVLPKFSHFYHFLSSISCPQVAFPGSKRLLYAYKVPFFSFCS